MEVTRNKIYMSKKRGDTTRYRIFISSPGDVNVERDVLEEIIRDDLQHKLGKQYNLYLEPVRWEKLARPSLGDIQTNIFEQLGEYDIFIGVFWNRFGSPTEEYSSGSEAEFYDAYSKWLMDTSRPVMMYFCERPDPIDLSSIKPDEAFEKLQQAQKVKQFREKLDSKGLYWTYKTIDEFKKQVSNHLHDALIALVNSSDIRASISEKTADPIRLRSIPEHLTRDEVKAMLRRLGLFDEKKNWTAQGIRHQYKTVNDIVVGDATTSLMWERDGSTEKLTYADAERYIEEINSMRFAGYVDWRMPTLEEVMSLLEREKNANGLYISTIFGKAQDWVWTVDTLNESRHWSVSFGLGGCHTSLLTSQNCVRAVREI